MENFVSSPDVEARAKQLAARDGLLVSGLPNWLQVWYWDRSRWLFQREALDVKTNAFWACPAPPRKPLPNSIAELVAHIDTIIKGFPVLPYDFHGILIFTRGIIQEASMRESDRAGCEQLANEWRKHLAFCLIHQNRLSVEWRSFFARMNILAVGPSYEDRNVLAAAACDLKKALRTS